MGGRLMKPLEQSFAFDEVEAQLKALYIDVINEVFTDTVNDIHHYGMPHFGSAKVIERFTKQDGLVVLRRPNSSDLIMRVIYANWISMGSKRGLSFLQFVLQMLLGDQWRIHRLYHDRERTEQYPSLVTTQRLSNSFLTSRVMIDLDANVNFAEILEMLPTLMRLVPANIVPTLTSSLDFNDMEEMGLAVGFIPYMYGNFKHIDYGDIPVALWTNWLVSHVVAIRTNGQTIYGARKTNAVEVMQSFAYINLTSAVQASVPHPDYSDHPAVLEAAQLTYPDATDTRIDGGLVKIAERPDVIDYDEVMRMMMMRLEQFSTVQEADESPWIQQFDQVLAYHGWQRDFKTVKKTISAPQRITSPSIYRADDVVSYDSPLNAAQMQVKYLQPRDAAWTSATLLDLRLEQETETRADYVQSYQKDGQIYEYYIVVRKEVNPDHVPGTITTDVELPAERVRWALGNAQAAYLSNPGQYSYLRQSVARLVDEAYQYSSYAPSNALILATEKTLSYAQISDGIFINLRNQNSTKYVRALDYLTNVALSVFKTDPADRFVDITALYSQFDANEREVIYAGDPLQDITAAAEVQEADFRVVITWSNPNPHKDSGKIAIYRSLVPFTSASLPGDPIAVINDPTLPDFYDYSVTEGGTYYYMLRYTELDQHVYSPLLTVSMTFANSDPTNLTVSKTGSGYQLSWDYTRSLGDGFEYYRSTSPMAINNMPDPRASGIMTTSYLDPDIDDLAAQYMRIGMRKDNILYLSNEVVINSNYAHNLTTKLQNGDLLIEWKHTAATVSFNVYVDDQPIIEGSLPAPVANVSSRSYTHTDPDQVQYIRIGAVVAGTEYLSREMVFKLAPYDLVAVHDNGAIRINLQTDHFTFQQLKYYVSDTPMTIGALPAPAQSNIYQTEFYDRTSNVQGVKYIRVGVVIDADEYVSDEVQYFYDYAYNIAAEPNGMNIDVSWNFDSSTYDSFNFYVSSDELDLDMMLPAMQDGISTTHHTNYDIVPFYLKYMRIGTVIGAKENISDQYHYALLQPHSVAVGDFAGVFGISWGCDYADGVTFNVYVSATPIDTNALPAPVASGISAMFYNDSAADLKARKYVCIGAVRAGVEYLSAVIDYRYGRPFNVTAARDTEIEISWEYDRTIPTAPDHGFNVYVSDTALDPLDLPAPVASGLHVPEFVDTVSDPDTPKHIIIGIRRAGREYLSEQITV